MYVKLKEEFKIIEFINNYMSQIEIRQLKEFNPFDEIEQDKAKQDKEEQDEVEQDKKENLLQRNNCDYEDFKNNHYLLDNEIKNDEYKRINEIDSDSEEAVPNDKKNKLSHIFLQGNNFEIILKSMTSFDAKVRSRF